MTVPRNKLKAPGSVARINPKLNKNLTAYMAAAGAAGVSLLALTPSAEAKVVYTPTYKVLGTTILDINHDGIYDFAIRSYGFCTSRFASGSLCGGGLALSASGYSKGKFMGTGGSVAALRAGAKIGPTAEFGARDIIGSTFERFRSGTIGAPNWFDPFANGGKGVRDRYIGMRFNIGLQTHYGWIRVSVQIANPKKPGFKAIITGYAYETEPNTPIIAGQQTGTAETSSLTQPTQLAPQTPATLGMLARGADTLPLWRREEAGGR
jgi:hypothetical protein